MTDQARQRRTTILMALGITATLIGYLSVWLPNRNAGLSFIGVELGEWVKFLPQVRNGEVIASRNWFYVPPITLGLIMALWTASWPRRPQTWLMRGFAVVVSLLAFPAVEAILNEPSAEWRLRLILIGVVILTALLAPRLANQPHLVTTLIVICALIGMGLPTWAYLEIRPIIADLLRTTVGLGIGVVLNAIGQLLVAIAALLAHPN